MSDEEVLWVISRNGFIGRGYTGREADDAATQEIKAIFAPPELREKAAGCAAEGRKVLEGHLGFDP